MKRLLRNFAVALACGAAAWLSLCCATAAPINRQPLGDAAAATGWQGLKRGGVLPIPGEVVFTYPPGTNGWRQSGLRIEHAGTADWRDFYGLQLEVKLDGNRPVTLTALARIPAQPEHPQFIQETQATVTVTGAGWHTLTLPWSSFDFEPAQPAFLKFVQELRVGASFADGKGAGKVTFRAVRLVKGEALALSAEIRGKSARPGETVNYVVSVGNCTDGPQTISLAMEAPGRNAMTATIEPMAMQLVPGETKECVVRVKVSERVPPGGHEEQWLRAIPNGDAARAARLSLVTASFLPHPYLVHTAAEWQEVRDKVLDHAWAKKTQEAFVKQAQNWTVPEAAPAPMNLTGVDTLGPFLFETGQQSNLLAAAYSWELTRDTNAAGKAALFLKRFANPVNGYPATGRCGDGDMTDEGVFMQANAMAYDMILDAGVLADSEREQIESAFRLYIEAVRLRAETGAISRSAVAQMCGALYSALAIQDWNLASRNLYGPAGILDQISNGVMDDGWWYECSVANQTSVASEFSQAALALRPWGVNLVDSWMPPAYARIPQSTPPGQAGASLDKFGPVTRNYVNLKRLWDALPPFADYRGMIFGLNDSPEQTLAGNGTKGGFLPFEIACYLYRDPAYATIIKHGIRRDLIYGLSELPELAPELADAGVYADNAGVVMLRSRAAEPRARVEAVLHYGTHGGDNGHFDRTGLLALQRYGKSFLSPETAWNGSEPFMRQFYVQSSVAANLVVVDDQQQEPVESPRLLFFAGDFMQAAAVETEARWSDPPFGAPAAEQTTGLFGGNQSPESRSLPILTNVPLQGAIDLGSDRVRQRRLLIVMPDYVVLADYLKAPHARTFDNLFHLKGFAGLVAKDKELLRHDGQMTTNSRSAAQFVTDCDWYSALAPSRATFNDLDGFKLDVISLWPSRLEIMIASSPEAQPVNKQVSYAVRGEGKTLREGKFDAGILGRENLDVSLAGVTELRLETSVSHIEREAHNSLFWGDPRVVLADGSEKSLADLPLTFENIILPKKSGEDYYGGPVKLAGTAFDAVTPAEPLNQTAPGMVRIDLSGLQAARFQAALGGDYPTGNEAQQRKTYAIRSTGSEARYLTLIEPHEKDSVIRKAEAFGSSRLRIELTDGRVQEIEISNLDGDGAKIVVRAQESRNGSVIRSETTAAPSAAAGR